MIVFHVISPLLKGEPEACHDFSVIPSVVRGGGLAYKGEGEKYSCIRFSLFLLCFQESSRFKTLTDLFRSASSKKVDKDQKRTQIQVRASIS